MDAKINHILFKNLYLVLQFTNSKGLQQGENHIGPWHLYSNRNDPKKYAFIIEYLYHDFYIAPKDWHYFLEIYPFMYEWAIHII